MLKRTKILSTLVVFMLIVSLVGCGSPVAPEQSTDKPAEQTVEQPAAQETEESIDVIAEAVNAYFANMPEDIYKINQKTFIEKVQAEEDMFILDIRKPDVYAEGHVKGAVNAPWGTAISDNLDKLPTDKPIMIYCYSGQTAGQTVALLNMAGFDAKSVNLGWNFGISKVDGYEAIVEQDANDFGESEGLDTDPKIVEAIKAYYSGLADVKDTTYANYKISEDNLKDLVDSEDDSIALVSIRSAKDFAEGHIESSTNLPWGKGMQEQFSTLPKDKTIVIYCYSGQTAGQTVAGLRMLGYDAVSLNGGIGVKPNNPIGWKNKGNEVVK